MANSRKQSASLLTVVVVFSLFIIAGLAVGGAVTNAEWKGSSGVPTLEAVGNVIAKNQTEAPKSAKGAERIYLKVDFATDDGTIFVIPFREHDMEAIPLSVPAHEEQTGGVSWTCGSNNGCQQYSTPVITRKVPAVTGHGILRYHQCDGYFYCFDSFKGTAKAK